MLGREVFLKAGCPVWQCETYDYYNSSIAENNGTAWQEYDAIVISNWDLKEQNLLADVSRSPHQRYIFWSIEAPTATATQASDNVAFNLTMSYRWDSDVVIPYGWSYPKERVMDGESIERLPISEVKKNYARGKTKLAAWFVSNCWATNGRLDYVERLQDFVPIDIYGHCGTLNCSSIEHKWFDDSCREMVRMLMQQHQYYFIGFQ